MESNKERIYEILIKILKEFAEEKELDILESPDLSTNLYGNNGTLDSLALVRLAVELEEAISEEFDKDITIVDDRAMSQKRSPFKNVGSLVDYLTNLVEEEN